MTRRTQLISMLGLGSALLVSSVAQAQPPRPGGPPVAVGGAASAAPAGSTDPSVVSNAADLAAARTSGSDPGYIPPSEQDGATSGRSGSLPNTGGSPWLMALAGSAIACSGLMLRRKLG